jgi:hypothetical protein
VARCITGLGAAYVSLVCAARIWRICVWMKKLNCNFLARCRNNPILCACLNFESLSKEVPEGAVLLEKDVLRRRIKKNIFV